MNTNTNPRNAQQALRLARCLEKAQTMTGYRLERIGGFKDLFVVHSPEGAEYGVDVLFNRCDCPDFQKHKDCCKHILWAKVEYARQEEAEMEKALCAAYEQEQAMAECAAGVDYLL